MAVDLIKRVETLEDKDMTRALADIRKANEEMNFFDNMVRPYSYLVSVREMVESAENYEDCTRSSKQVLKAEVNGLIDIINHWIELFNEPQIEVEFTVGESKGKRNTFAYSTAEMFIELGIAKRV